MMTKAQSEFLHCHKLMVLPAIHLIGHNQDPKVPPFITIKKALLSGQGFLAHNHDAYGWLNSILHLLIVIAFGFTHLLCCES
jgi:hypothetical protein